MKKAVEFSVLVCVISWTLSLGIYFVTGGATRSMYYSPLAALYMLLPMATAMLLQKFRYREKFRSTGLFKGKITWTWVAAWFFMPVLIAAAVAVSSLVPGISFSWTLENYFAMLSSAELGERIQLIPLPVFYLAMIFGGMIAGATINAAFALGEEYGWRNFLVSALRKYKFWQVSLFGGFVWGIWHFPLILMGHNYPSAPVWGVPMMVAFCILLTPSMLYFTIKTRSVIVAAIMHGTMNALAGIGMILLNGGTNFNSGILGWPGFAVIILGTWCLYLYDRHIAAEHIFTSRVEDHLKTD